jgi:hypothetical protein
VNEGALAAVNDQGGKFVAVGDTSRIACSSVLE